MKRRKPQSERKGTSIRFRLTDAEKAGLEEAASRAHMDLSVWLLDVAFKAAGIVPKEPK